MLSDAYFDRFQSQKYRNKNPVQRALIRRFVSTFHSFFLEAMPVASVLEVGVGEGFLSGYLSEKLPGVSFTGIDLGEADVAACRAKFPRVDARVGNAYDLSSLGDFDLVVCAEVLEHLDTPEAALDQILARHPRHVILTVPHEPLFRGANFLRGKNVSRLGNDIEHVNHWGPRSFRRLLEPRFEVLRVATSFPWLLTLNRPR